MKTEYFYTKNDRFGYNSVNIVETNRRAAFNYGRLLDGTTKCSIAHTGNYKFRGSFLQLKLNGP